MATGNLNKKFFMTKSEVRLTLIFFAFVFVAVLSCASSTVGPNSVSEIWIGKVTGMAIGDVNIIIKRPPQKDNTFPFRGRVIITANEIAGGYGQSDIDCIINGAVKDGDLNARAIGTARSIGRAGARGHPRHVAVRSAYLRGRCCLGGWIHHLPRVPRRSLDLSQTARGRAALQATARRVTADGRFSHWSDR